MNGNGNRITFSGEFKIGIAAPLLKIFNKITLKVVVNWFVGWTVFFKVPAFSLNGNVTIYSNGAFLVCRPRCRWQHGDEHTER